MATVRVAQQMGLDTIANRKPMTFSEDFAHFNEAVPGCFFLLGNGEAGAHGQPLHSDDYDFNDDLLRIGTNSGRQLFVTGFPLMVRHYHDHIYTTPTAIM